MLECTAGKTGHGRVRRHIYKFKYKQWDKYHTANSMEGLMRQIRIYE
jgi:hypothetical protein